MRVEALTGAQIESLERALSPDSVVRAGDPERVLYARDCWPLLVIATRAGRHAIDPPDVVVYPGDERDVIATVRWCAEHRVPLVPYGAGSGVAGAAVPVRGGVTLDLKRLDHLDLSYLDSGMVRAGAGWVGARLEHRLQTLGWTLGHFPSSIGCSTVGGYLATRSAGQLSTRFGKIEDMVVGLRYVDSRGRTVETFGAPHDTTQLLVGSEGTLGVILDAWLRVEPAPVARRYRGFLAPSVADGLDAMRRVMQRGHRPAVLRLYDQFDSYLTIRGYDDAPDAAIESSGLTAKLKEFIGETLSDKRVRRTALSAAGRLLSRSMGAPLVLNRLADGLYDGCLLIAGVEEADEEVADRKAEAVFAEIAESAEDIGRDAGEHWFRHRYDVSYKQSPVFDAGLFVDTMEVSSSWERVEPMYREVRRAVGRHAFIMAHFSHAYAEGGSIYFTFAGFGRDDDECVERYRRTWNAGLDAVSRAGGSMTHHHGVGILKAARLYSDHRGGEPLFEMVKHAADPDNVLNPGKLWHAEGTRLWRG